MQRSDLLPQADVRRRAACAKREGGGGEKKRVELRCDRHDSTLLVFYLRRPWGCALRREPG